MGLLDLFRQRQPQTGLLAEQPLADPSQNIGGLLGRALMQTPQRAQSVGDALLGAWNNMDATDKAATVAGFIPGYGDAIGVANDFRHYATEPESRTLANFGLTALGALPMIPGAATTMAKATRTYKPQTLADRIRTNLEKRGYEVNHVASRRSNSQYIYANLPEDTINAMEEAGQITSDQAMDLLNKPVSVRVSDHQNPASKMWRQTSGNDRAELTDFELRADQGSDWRSVLDEVLKKLPPVPKF